MKIKRLLPQCFPRMMPLLKRSIAGPNFCASLLTSKKEQHFDMSECHSALLSTTRKCGRERDVLSLHYPQFTHMIFIIYTSLENVSHPQTVFPAMEFKSHHYYKLHIQILLLPKLTQNIHIEGNICIISKTI